MATISGGRATSPAAPSAWHSPVLRRGACGSSRTVHCLGPGSLIWVMSANIRLQSSGQSPLPQAVPFLRSLLIRLVVILFLAPAFPGVVALGDAGISYRWPVEYLDDSGIFGGSVPSRGGRLIRTWTCRPSISIISRTGSPRKLSAAWTTSSPTCR